jgi:hypothetical protein
MWGTEHALVDPSRYHFMDAGWKNTNALRSPPMRLWGRMPASHRIGASTVIIGGAGYGIYELWNQGE